ncbi:MAG: hypothetical protein KAG64_00530 [Bacteroidales bacterium]|nr:hypothetical protein [Bacteroidales bacterium]
MTRILIIFSILFIGFQTLYAQSSTVFQKTFTENMELKFQPEYTTSSLPNYFIDEIAKALPKIRMYVKINYQYELQTKVVKKGSKYLLCLKIKQINHGGFFKYKKFDFSHLISPAIIEQRFLVKDLSSNTKHYQKVKVSFGSNDSASTYINGLKGVITYKISLDPSGVRYYYGDEQKAEFQKAVNDIDNYYDDALKLDAIEKRVNALKYDDAGIVAIRNVDLKYIEKDLSKIQIESYRKSLNLDSYDPIRLLQKYNNLKNLIDNRRQDMNQKMENLDYINYSEALNQLKVGNEREAVLLFKKSIQINPYFSPSVYQLSLIDYQHNRYNDCLSKSHHLLSELKPDLETKSKSISLANTCYNSLMEQCWKFNQEERFNQSMAMLEKAKTYCDSTMYIKCDSRLEQYISQATYGLYASYLSIANASLKKGRLDMCQDYMKMAKNYKLQNKEKLTKNNAKAQQIIVALIESLVNESEIARGKGDFTEANKLLSQAKVLCDDSPKTNCKLAINKKEAMLHQSEYNALIKQSLYYSKKHNADKSKEYLSLAMTYQNIHSDYIPTSIGTDTIVGKVRYIMYNEAIDNGKIDFEQKKYQYALIAFAEARELEREYSFKKNPNLNTYLQQAAKPITLDLLSKGKLKAWGKHYIEAQNLLDSAIMIIQQYDLTSDSEVKNSIYELHESIKKNDCDKLITQYNALIKKANMSLRFEDYHNASLFWKKAVSLGEKKPNCQIKTKTANTQLHKYQVDISYSNEIFLADSLKLVNAENAFTHLLRAEKIRQNKSFHIHSSKTKPLIDILFEYNKPVLNILGISYYVENNNQEEALKLCKFALISGQIIDNNLISKVAILTASFDKKANSDMKLMANKRFGNKKEYKDLKKAYLRSLRK